MYILASFGCDFEKRHFGWNGKNCKYFDKRNLRSCRKCCFNNHECVKFPWLKLYTALLCLHPDHAFYLKKYETCILCLHWITYSYLIQQYSNYQRALKIQKILFRLLNSVEDAIVFPLYFQTSKTCRYKPLFKLILCCDFL